ncbi:hypothetical protein [Cellulomonas alba]|uniref:Uncharacterized protein n=1 Tax=Cellulomonas alba TaxID=3053467 RepID=A0ABT7SJY8_9CELL|nr:hypothetical protein [Cellulomonas alba]MDM7855869.1 hypothetical protein [Cellulomonas alba]
MTSSYQSYLHTPSAVLSDGIVIVPLWSVTQMSIEETYSLPQIGGTSRKAAVASHDDTISMTAVLLGAERFAWKLALENLAESSRRGTALQKLTQGAVGGLILVTAATIRTDLAVQSLGITLSAARRDTLDVTLRMAHLPRPGSLAKLLDIASVGVGALTDLLPR